MDLVRSIPKVSEAMKQVDSKPGAALCALIVSQALTHDQKPDFAAPAKN